MKWIEIRVRRISDKFSISTSKNERVEGWNEWYPLSIRLCACCYTEQSQLSFHADWWIQKSEEKRIFNLPKSITWCLNGNPYSILEIYTKVQLPHAWKPFKFILLRELFANGKLVIICFARSNFHAARNRSTPILMFLRFQIEIVANRLGPIRW